MQGEIDLSVLLYEEGGRWVAQGLEYDITASGSSPPDATKRFIAKVGAELVISAELMDEAPLSGVPAAPRKFWEMWEQADMEIAQPTRVPLRILDGIAQPNLKPVFRIAEKQAA